MRKIYSVLMALLVVLSISGLGAAVTITGLSDVSTADTTPNISFTITGNNSSYVANLYIDSVASGSVTAVNATSATITCNQTLASGFSGTYYITAYNATENPTLTTSTTYNISTSSIAGIVVVIGDVTGVFTPIVDLIVAVGTIMIAIAMIIFVMGIILALFAAVKGGLGRLGK